jgi:hypothetical protein
LPGIEIAGSPGGAYFPAAALFAPQKVERWGHAQALTDAQGHFRLEPLHPLGVYQLSCRPDPAHPKRARDRPDVPAGTAGLEWIASESELVGGVVTGQVLSSETGGPVTDFTLEVVERVGEDGFRPRTLAPRSDPDGRFRVEGLEFGTIYGLLVRAEGWGAREVPWWTASEEGHEVLVRLERQASLEFEVRDSFGVPAGLALVVLEAQREVKGNDPWAWRQQHTDERGIVLLEQLDPGPYHVRVTRGELHAEADLTVTGGSAMHERLDLHAP